MREKGVTIFVSAYKATAFMGECLDSIYASMAGFSYPWELLLGVDGCQDTLDCVMAYPLGYDTSVYYFDQNVGTYVVSNTLIELARYDYMVRFDSDDIMLPALPRHLQLAKFATSGNLLRLTYRNIVSFKPFMYRPGKSGLTVATGIIGIPETLLPVLGGYRSWRCAADADLLVRSKRSGAHRDVIRSFDPVNPSFLRRTHAASLTKCVEYGAGSEIRKRYHALGEHDKRTIYVEPVVANCRRMA